MRGAALLLLVAGLVPERKAAAAPPDAKPAPLDAPTYAVHLRDLDNRIEELTEQIRRSRARLALLSATIFSTGDAGARATVKFENELSKAFRVTRVLVVLDGAVQYQKADTTGELADQREIPIFSGSIPAGDHTLQMLVNLQGDGFGVFSYLRGYKFEVRSTHSFTVVEGKTMNLSVVAFEKGDSTTPLEQRPTVRYGERLVAGTLDAPAAR